MMVLVAGFKLDEKWIYIARYATTDLLNQRIHQQFCNAQTIRVKDGNHILASKLNCCGVVYPT
jgi:hypothetical protein